ncbi:MAG: hypothetical protein SGARI_008181, partial [Bacillariaceae sp.]
MSTSHNNNNGVPQEFLDPITQKLMRDPVVLSSGIIIDSSTSKRIPIDVIRYARDLKATIDLWRKRTALDSENARSSSEGGGLEEDDGDSIMSDPTNSQRESNTTTVSAEFDDAIAFITVVKERYSHHPEIYKEFLNLMDAFQANIYRGKDGFEEMLEQAAVLFSENPDLWTKFLDFFPEWFRVETTSMVQYVTKKMTTYKD